MILDLSIQTDVNKAQVYLDKLVSDQSGIELKKIHKLRTNKQNRYVHALFTLFGGEFGYNPDEAKVVVKRRLGYVYDKNGEEFLVKTSAMDTKELTTFIDRFRNFSSSEGCYLPSADEMNENYIEIMKQVEYIEATQKRYSY